ncbi:hypothetical protein AM571_CH01133 [Rhizobium etli 8C-3]|uniref:Uncharacterized protein n=1 Tax=Rhizobium etli 8C-3 TaxID=538025 RepID=A0A1L5P1C9_RHIET|nr:hypothetical protein AM571_CH01133 [Rhizobium etli 8C-3]
MTQEGMDGRRYRLACNASRGGHPLSILPEVADRRHGATGTSLSASHFTMKRAMAGFYWQAQE